MYSFFYYATYEMFNKYCWHNFTDVENVGFLPSREVAPQPGNGSF